MNNFDYNTPNLAPADVIISMGRSIVVNMNRAEQSESFQDYAEFSLRLSPYRSINLIVKGFNDLSLTSNGCGLDEIKDWVRQKTNPQGIDTILIQCPEIKIDMG